MPVQFLQEAYFKKKFGRKEAIYLAKNALTKSDWKALRKRGIAFSSIVDDELFNAFLDAMYRIKTSKKKTNPSEIDALMMYLAHAEPPILV